MKEEIGLLKEAAFEINNLRRQNELMKARLEMFDNVMQLINTIPIGKGYGYSPDIVNEIEKFIGAQPKENT